MSLEETKEKIELRKSAFECKQKNTFGIENQNYMTRMHENKLIYMCYCALACIDGCRPDHAYLLVHTIGFVSLQKGNL